MWLLLTMPSCGLVERHAHRHRDGCEHERDATPWRHPVDTGVHEAEHEEHRVRVMSPIRHRRFGTVASRQVPWR